MAFPEPSSNDGPKAAKPGDKEDRDFDPSAEALIDDIDDERTLEEEEALNGVTGAAVQEELDDLKKESEMPIEELLAYYERLRSQAGGEGESEDEESGDDDEDEEEEDEDEEGDDDQDDDDDSNQPAKKRRKDQEPPTSDGDPSGQGSSKGPTSSSEQPAKSSAPAADSTSQNSEQKQQESSSKQTDNIAEVDQLETNKSDSPTQKKTPTPPSPTSSITQSSNNNSKSIEPNTIDSTATSDIRTPSTTSEQPTNQQLDTDISTNQPTESSRPNNSNEADVDQPPGLRQRQRMTQFNLTDNADNEDGQDDGNGIFKTLLGYDLDDSDDMDEDYSYTDDEYEDDGRDWRRVIHVGPEYQAEVPESLSEYDDLPPYQNEDQLVWGWQDNLTTSLVIDYLKKASLISKRTDICISSASVPKVSYDNMRAYRERMQSITSSSGLHTIDQHNHISSTTEHPTSANLQDVYMNQSRKSARIDYELEQENDDGINQAWRMTQNQTTNDDNSDSSSADARPDLSTEDYFQDEEQLLYLLTKCNFNIDEALRRRNIDPIKYYLHEPMTLWSQEECLGFEHGLRTYGKDFRSIRDNRVQTRTHAEVVAFYYLWKKSERHDVYTNQYKLDRKRSLSHPGTTDYMDKFMDYNDSILNASSSPTPTPTESTVGADSLLERARQIQTHSFPLSRQTYLQPLMQDTPINTHTDNDTCPEKI